MSQLRAAEGRCTHETMSTTAYDNCLNDAGDVSEAKGGICQTDWSESIEIRKYLGLSEDDACRVLALLGILAETMSMLLGRCGLSERAVVEKLCLLHSVAGHPANTHEQLGSGQL